MGVKKTIECTAERGNMLMNAWQQEWFAVANTATTAGEGDVLIHTLHT